MMHIEQSASVNVKEWSSGKKFVFYFLFSYYFLYAFPQLLDGLIPLLDAVLEKYYAAIDSAVSFAGDAVLHLGFYEPDFSSGSGDQPFFYVRLLVFILVSLLSALIWLYAGRKYKTHNRLYEILHVYLRYFLAVILLSYGFGKVFPSQMPPLTPVQLTQPYGQFSPMGIAWAFMGASPSFQIFTGILEVLAGGLLLFRRTVLPGALLAAVVFSGVVAFNFCYDIPVKINSVNYLVIAVFTALRYRRSLVSILLLHKPAAAPPDSGLWQTKWLKRTRLAVKPVYIIAVIYLFATDAYSFYSAVKQREEHPLYGVYDVDLFIRNNDTIPLVKNDASVWNKAVLSYPGVLSVRDMKDSLHRYPILDFDSTKQQVIFTERPGDTVNVSTLSYQKDPGGGLLLTGKLRQDSVSVHMKLIDRSHFLAVNRGFHWINERPFNK